jgi:hypothetical protein
VVVLLFAGADTELAEAEDAEAETLADTLPDALREATEAELEAELETAALAESETAGAEADAD